MQTVPVHTHTPSFDEADRLRKALRESGVSVQEMAEYLGVSRNTVSRWINGAVPPKAHVMRLWALRTGVPYEWLAGKRSVSRRP